MSDYESSCSLVLAVVVDRWKLRHFQADQGLHLE